MLILPEIDPSTLKKDYAKFSVQLRTLNARVLQQVKSDPMHIKSKFVETIFMGLVNLAVFYGLDGNGFNS